MKKDLPGGDRAFRDPAIPGIARLLDPEAAARTLARLHPSAVRPETVSVQYVRYKPGRSLLVGFEASFAGVPFQAYAKAYARGEAARDEAKARARPKAPRGALLPFTAFREEEIVLFAFPNDAELRDLRYLGDLDRFKRIVARAFPERTAEGWRAKARGTRIEIVRYKPEDRCVFRVRLRWRSDRTGGREEALLYGRVLPREEASRVARTHRALLEVPGAGPTLPPLLGFDPDCGLLFLGAIEGAPSLDAGPEEMGRRIGAALRAFQASSTPLPPAESATEKRDRLLEYFEALSLAAPEISARATRLLRPIDLPRSGGSATVHGDFHAEQVLFSNGRVAFLDLDRTGRGDAEIDAASFRAHLRLLALRGERTAEDVDRRIAGFEETYGTLSPAGKSLEGLSFLDLASSAVRRLEAGWEERLENTLDALEPSFSVSRGGRARTVGTLLGSLLDPDRARVLLAERFGVTLGGEARLERAAIRRDGALEFEFIGEGRSAWAILAEDGKLAVLTDPGRAGPGATAEALEPAGASDLLRRMEPSAARVARADLLSLRPHRRAVVRWTLEGTDRLRIAKLLPPSKAERLAENWMTAGEGRGEPVLPRLLGSAPERGLLLLEDIPGRSLKSFWGEASRREAVSAAARALRSFHGRPTVQSSERTAMDEIETVRRAASALDRFDAPWHAERLAALELLSSLALPPTVPPSRLHGDFYDRQVLSGPRGIAFLDLDARRSGDPAIDLGNFAAHLFLREAQGTLPPGEAARLQGEALRAYGVGGDGFEGRFAFFRSASLARLLCQYSIRAKAPVVVPALLKAVTEASEART